MSKFRKARKSIRQNALSTVEGNQEYAHRLENFKKKISYKSKSEYIKDKNRKNAA